tara:strand:- start:4350 stop:5576 length:1227 start_codon:yes stop_codon:yes gene_type:complete
MRKVRFAVVFDQVIHSGGGYQQALNLSLSVSKVSNEIANIKFYTTLKKNIHNLTEIGINAIYINLTPVEKFLIYSKTSPLISSFMQPLQKILKINCFEKILLRHKVDLVYFVAPSRLAADLDKLNYIFTMWDLCHRDHPEFPEVRFKNQFEIRELMYKNILPKATTVIAESQTSKKKLSLIYGIDEKRIKVIPLLPSPMINNKCSNYENEKSLISKYQKLSPYVFYPAQFWPHKNHVFILDGLKLLEDEFGIIVSAVFSGTNQGNLDYILAYAKKLRINQRIIFAGFVSSNELQFIYKNSLALVMPTYFGPSNIPPLEAFSMGVPVIYPNMPGSKEQLGNAYLSIDLTNPHSLKEHLKLLLEKENMRKLIIKNGYEILNKLNKTNSENFFEEILITFQRKMLCWDQPK